MPLISGTVPSLVNGVSQQPATLRMPTQGQRQENGFSHISRGLEKRPCTEHLAEIQGITSANSNDVFIHTIRRSEDEAYALLIKGGISGGADPVVKLYDLTGFATGTPGNEVYIHPTEQTGAVTGNGIINTDVKNYLKNFTSSGSNDFTPNKLSVTTVADFSFILNKTQRVKKKNTAHSNRQYESMAFVKIGDYDGHYKILVTQFDVYPAGHEKAGEIDHDAYLFQYEVEYATPQNNTESKTQGGSSAAANSASINNQAAVVVNNIAESLFFGADNTDKVYLIQETSNNTPIIISHINADGSPAYVGQTGVRDKGVVKTRYRHWNHTTNEFGAWTSISAKQEVVDSVTPNDDFINIAGTTFVDNDKVIVHSSDGLPAPLEEFKTYYVVNKTVGKFKLALTEGGTAINLTTAGGSTLLVTQDNAGLKNINDYLPSSGKGSATSWTTSYVHGESIIYISADYDEANSYPFDIEASDGKGDANMVAINGADEVPSFGKLPGSKVEPGFVAKISGDKSTGQDDYYVSWNGSVWKETFRPKYSQISNKRARDQIDETTMPVQLYKAFDTNDKIYFILKLIEYPSRTVGDDVTNPFPSFADYDEDLHPNGLYKINDIFFHRNRLGFISDENVILSEAANYFNFFANTVLSVLDTSVVDVAVSNNQVAILKSAIPFQESLLLFSDLQQFKLSSDEFLTPTSVSVAVATNFETSTEAKPVPAGKTIFFPFQRGAFSGIREYMIDVASETNDANEVTSHVPDYIEGVVKKMAVSSNEELLCVLADDSNNSDSLKRKELIVYKYYYSDQEKLQSSWSKWIFDAEIIDMEFIGSVAYLLFRRNNKIYLEKLNLSVDVATNTMDDKIGVRLDRRVKLEWDEVSANPPALSSYYNDINHDKVGQAVEKTISSIDVANNVFTSTAHGFQNDYRVHFTSTTTLPGEIKADTKYYIVNKTDNTFQVAKKQEGTPHVIANAGSGTIKAVFDDTKAKGVLDTKTNEYLDQWGKRINLDNIEEKPRVGQKFTLAHDRNNTYTVTDVSDKIGTTVEIEFTPSIASEASIDQGGPLPHNTSVIFEERDVLYVCETGEILKEAQVAGVLKEGTTYSQSRGNNHPVVFVGIPYDFRYEFSEQFVKSGEESINSGRLQMRNFEISYDRTGFFEVEVSPKPYDNRLRRIFNKTFTGRKIGSLFLGKQELDTGVFRVPVYVNSKDVKITVQSDSWLPVALQSADFEAFQVLRNKRI